MLRNGCASIREGDLFHGRYRILRSIEDDRTGALYEAIDMMNDAHRILKVVQAETLAGTGIRVRFKSDAPLWDSGNVAYLSDAGLDRDTRSFFLIMDLAEDSDLEPVTKQRVIRLGDSGSSEKPAVASPSDTPPAIEPGRAHARVVSDGHDTTLREWPNPDGTLTRRASVPLPLPPPLPPSASRVSQLALPPPPPLLPINAHSAVSGSLPPPTPPPERALPEVAPLPRKRALGSAHFVAFVAVAISVGSVVYFRSGRAASERLPERTGVSVTNAPEIFAPLSTTPATPSTAAIAASDGERELPDASVPANWVPSETTSTKPEETAADTAPSKVSPPNKAQPNTTPPAMTTQLAVQPKAASPKASPSSTMIKPRNDHNAVAAPTKRHRESIY